MQSHETEPLDPLEARMKDLRLHRRWWADGETKAREDLCVAWQSHATIVDCQRMIERAEMETSFISDILEGLRPHFVPRTHIFYPDQ